MQDFSEREHPIAEKGVDLRRQQRGGNNMTQAKAATNPLSPTMRRHDSMASTCTLSQTATETPTAASIVRVRPSQPRQRNRPSRLSAVGVAFLSSLVTLVVDAKTVHYRLVIRPRLDSPGNVTYSPDCWIDRPYLLANDMNPGPEVRANVGDTVRITLTNKSPSDVVTIRYHGLTMKGQPYSDGTGAISQCAVGPLQTQVNEFVATDPGTHYWYSNVAMERTDGLQGPIIIDDPDDPEEMMLRELYDEERVIFLQDWYHRVGSLQQTGLDSDPFVWIGNPEAFLINGKGRYGPCQENPSDPSCDAACNDPEAGYVPDIAVEAGKTYRFRIISAVQLIGINIAIGDHTMLVVEADGTLVRPFTVENLDIMPAQRYSVLFRADGPVDNYWMTTAVRYRPEAPQGFATIKYDGAPDGIPGTSATVPTHPAWDDASAGPELDTMLFTRDITKYYDSDILKTPRKDVRKIVIVGTQGRRKRDNVLRWAANNVSTVWTDVPLIKKAYHAVRLYHAAYWPDTDIPGTVVIPDTPSTPFNYTEPVQDQVGESVGPAASPGIIKLTYGEVVDVVLQNALNLDGISDMHSWHLHGHKFYVIGQGMGTYDKSADTSLYNLIDPVRRDTATVLPMGWTAIRFYADNPGVWPLHCTQNSHMVMGLGLNFVVSPDMLHAPPPGVTNCFKTSLNVYDAERCYATGGSGGGSGRSGASKGYGGAYASKGKTAYGGYKNAGPAYWSNGDAKYSGGSAGSSGYLSKGKGGYAGGSAGYAYSSKGNGAYSGGSAGSSGYSSKGKDAPIGAIGWRNYASKGDGAYTGGSAGYDYLSKGDSGYTGGSAGSNLSSKGDGWYTGGSAEYSYASKGNGSYSGGSAGSVSSSKGSVSSGSSSSSKGNGAYTGGSSGGSGGGYKSKGTGGSSGGYWSSGSKGGSSSGKEDGKNKGGRNNNFKNWYQHYRMNTGG